MIKKLKSLFVRILFSFFVPYLYTKYWRQIKKLDPEIQLFLMTRLDLGTHLFMLHYARCWEERRGKTCIVMLTTKFEDIAQIAKSISPNTLLIYPNNRLLKWLLCRFDERRVHYQFFNKLYGRLATNFPDALCIYEETKTGRSGYNEFFDKHLHDNSIQLSDSFLQAYKRARKIFDYRYDVLLDLFHLNDECPFYRSTRLLAKQNALQNVLKAETPYVVLNINCKVYKNLAANRRPILNFKRYNVLIDHLIELGYNVALQGRDEQPVLASRKGLVDYSKSTFASIENDLALFSGAEFAILPKTGPEVFALICDLPVLGLNYTEWSALIPNVKSRFFPKHIKDKNGRFIHWKEMLESPSFFDMGPVCFKEEIEYEEMSEEELLNALTEFLPLVKQPKEKWTAYSPSQLAFKQSLNPFHLDLYYAKGVPCDTYLNNPKYSM